MLTDRPSPLARLGPLPCLVSVLVLTAACGSSATPAASGPSSPTAPATASSTASPSIPPSVAASSVPPSPSPSPTPPMCGAQDVALAHGRWEGAAGSRGTTVTIRNVSTEPCAIPGRALVALVDSNQRQLVATPPDSSASPLVLAAGESAASDVLVSNWCGPAPAFPVVLVVALFGSTAEVAGPQIATADELPPCNGSGPATIGTSGAWTRP
jgi:hypothetical protein